MPGAPTLRGTALAILCFRHFDGRRLLNPAQGRGPGCGGRRDARDDLGHQVRVRRELRRRVHPLGGFHRSATDRRLPSLDRRTTPTSASSSPSTRVRTTSGPTSPRPPTRPAPSSSNPFSPPESPTHHVVELNVFHDLDATESAASRQRTFSRPRPALDRSERAPDRQPLPPLRALEARRQADLDSHGRR